jgi:hypothetical protein
MRIEIDTVVRQKARQNEITYNEHWARALSDRNKRVDAEHERNMQLLQRRYEQAVATTTTTTTNATEQPGDATADTT